MDVLGFAKEINIIENIAKYAVICKHDLLF